MARIRSCFYMLPGQWSRICVVLLLVLVGLHHKQSLYAQGQTTSGATGAVQSQTQQSLPPVNAMHTSSAPPARHDVQRLPSSRRNSPQPAEIVKTQFDQTTAEVIPAPAPEAPRPPTLSDLENMALANNPTLVQATARIQAAQGRWLQGGLRPNPVIGYQASEVGNEGHSGQQGAFYSREFVRGGKLGLNRLVGNREIAQAQQQLEAQRLRVLNDVRIEYFNVLVAQRALELTQEIADIGKQGLETTQRLFQSRQVSNAEVLQARIEASSARIALQNAENRHAAAWRRLSSVVGTPDMSLQTLSGELTPQLAAIDWNEAYARVTTQSPELASARAGVARAQALLERAQAEPIPNLDVQLGLQYDNASQFTIGNVQMGMPIPFRNRNQGNIQTAFADLRNAQAEIGRLELSLRHRLALAFESYANARNQVDTFSNQILPDARSSLDLVSAAYRQGQVTFLTLLTAQRTFSQANLAYLQALQQFNASRVAIEGLLLTGSLQGELGSIESPRLMEGAVQVFGPGKPPVEQN